MRRLQTGQPVWDLHFDEKGRLTAPAQRDFLDEVIAEGVADLFMFSHGWGTSETGASELYNAMFPLIRRRFVREIAITEESVELAWTRVRAAADRFAAELKPSGYLVGDRFGVADLTLAALLAPALAPEQFPYPQPQRGHPLFHELRAVLAEHGLADWAREIYARHRGVSAEVRSPRR